MTWLSDAALDRLREVTDRPDLSHTPYEIEDEIGRGGMGVVYRARDPRLDRCVAVKVLNTAAGSDETRRLTREARVLARLEHPGIVPVHDVLELPDGRVAYVMKWIRGHRLDDHVKPETTLAERLRIFERVAEAVAFAHARGVIHRDLKPANVMIGPFGEVLVLDWGVAKVGHEPAPAEGTATESSVPHDARDTTHGTVLGTPGYMAPEQARGDVEAMDERTDVYALGGLLRDLLAGVDARIPRPLEAVIAKARSPDPEARYATVEDLAADVTQFRQGLAVAAYRENVFERLARVVRRYQLPIVLVLTYLVLRVLLLLFAPAG